MADPKLVGRCPSHGHPIYKKEDGEIEYSCQDPGRADGLYGPWAGKAREEVIGPMGEKSKTAKS